ncbi:polysaccharide deacetylase family protein [Candidatus Korobacter versatilis]|uniref:polysaccharide deacetylase family protein n=1 Tax=Candidatus Korobacter versatilis TaxID=658062 RepID=UPI0002E92566|nr:polysaccharide deacetylase family protein [Candidatus Koribacter versatilis]
MACAAAGDAFAEERARQIAFTFDDPKTDSGPGLTWQQVNDNLLAALDKANVKAALFVTGMRVDSEDGRKLVAKWNDAGHLIGSHSYSHLFFDSKKVTLAGFEADLLKNEPLVERYSQFQKLFRFPFFKEGNTKEKRDGMRAFLKEHGYRIGRATVDASDWAIDGRMRKRYEKDAKADLRPYRDFYLQHIWDRAQYYDSLAQRVLGRSPAHTVLLHHSPMNAMFLPDLIAQFKGKGWEPVDAAKAFADPVYDRQPDILPCGESLIWALAKETGKFDAELRYPGEDDVYENPKMDALGL